MFLSIGTANVARKGISCQGPLCDFLSDSPTDLVALPEADVPEFSSVGWINSWRCWDRFAALSFPVEGVCKVGLVSCLPLRPVQLRAPAAAGRHVAAMVECGVSEAVAETFLVVGVYLQCGNEPEAAGQFEEVLQACLATGFRFVIVGDFNLTPEHHIFLEYAASGLISLGDDCVPGGDLPPSGPVYRGARRRRIDFAVQHSGLRATQVFHTDGPSDHVVVSYSYDLAVPRPRRGPARRPLRDDITAADRDIALAEWNSLPFSEALEREDVDTAWTLLSACAEDILCQPSARAVPRADCWEPFRPGAIVSGKQPERSAGLRALMRLRSRLRVALQRPFDAQLRASVGRSLYGVRRLVPELPFIGRLSAETLFQVQALVDRYQAQEQEAGRLRWKLRARADLSVARGYIKRRADLVLQRERALADNQIPAGGSHPALEVDRQAREWEAKWSTRPHGGVASLAPVLAEVPRPPRCTVEFDFGPDELRSATAKMKGSSAGPDAWTAEALLSLPRTWWVHAASLWNTVVRRGVAPASWTRGRTCLIWKDASRTRPITVLPVIWRAGARLMNQRLRVWASSWQQTFDCGGLPGTSVATALQMLQFELTNQCRGGVQQDVSGFFDSLEHELTAAVLRHMRAPEAFTALFENVCSTSQRLFVLDGACAASWMHPSKGLPQGCPLSPLISAVITHAWACFVFGPRPDPQRPIAGFGYIDDRMILLRAHHSVAHLRVAVQKSSDFDRIFNLEVAARKCAVVAAPNDREASGLAATLGYSFVDYFASLGVRAGWHSGWGLLRFSLRKAVLRLKALQSLGLCSAQARLMIRSLVVPAAVWAASFASPSQADVNCLQKEVERCMHATAGHGVAKVLFYELVGGTRDSLCLG